MFGNTLIRDTWSAANDQTCKCTNQCTSIPWQLPLAVERRNNGTNGRKQKDRAENKNRLKFIVTLAHIQTGDRIRDNIVSCTCGRNTFRLGLFPAAIHFSLYDVSVLQQATSANVHSVWSSLEFGTTVLRHHLRTLAIIHDQSNLRKYEVVPVFI